MSWTMSKYLRQQREWSRLKFGDGRRTIGITRHIEKELCEIRENPTDLSEWIDVVILALDGYWRHGGTPETISRSCYEAVQELHARMASTPTRGSRDGASAMKPNFLNIDVKPKDINAGSRRDPTSCPIAHALSRRLKGAEVHVGFEEIIGGSQKYYCSRDIEQFMTDFDEGRPVKPSRFTLEALR